MQSKQLKSLESRLYEPLSIPIIGKCLQRKAALSLAQDGSPDAVKVLAQGVTRLKDEEILAIVIEVLSQLKKQACIDAVCQVWATTREQKLANLLVKNGWVASAPVEVRVLSALKAGKLAVVTSGGKEIVEPLLKAFQDRDSEIASRASQSAILFDKPEYQEFLCSLVIEQNHQIARQVAIKAKYTPREPSQRALF